MASVEDLTTKFASLGLTGDKAKEAAGNKKLAPTLNTIVDATGQSSFEKVDGHAAVQPGHDGYQRRRRRMWSTSPGLSPLAGLASSEQVSAATKFCAKNDPAANEQAFDEACGVGVEVSDAAIAQHVTAVIDSMKAMLVEQRYRALGRALGAVKKTSELRWANSGKVKDEFDAQVLALLGPKDERDDPAKLKKAAKAAKPAKNAAQQESKGWEPATLESISTSRCGLRIWRRPGGKVVTRFPPEPNGYLHIGHAKAINVNFGYAKNARRRAEEEEYVRSILDMVLYSSDYFQQLYELAVKLIEAGHAYVCHCSGEEIHQQRGGEAMGPRFACPHRERPVAESLAEFQKMKDGRYAANEAILRMKMDLEDGNPQMWDLWCIYPTYDFTHCLCDSFENITHSLCTREFTNSRQSYYWLCDAVEVYKPVQWEYGRLNITNTVLSKRKLLKLRDDGHVTALDDPRLYTLPALRRRGVPPQAINAFANTTIDVVRLENHIRDALNELAPRVMAAISPVKVVIENLPADHLEMIDVLYKPRDESFGTHKVPFTRTLYIDASDFRETDSADYYRLAPNKTVGLQNVAGPITCTDVRKNADGSISEIVCRLEDAATAAKPKTYIQWVAESPEHGSPVRLDEVRVYDALFKHANPYDKNEVPGGWLSDVNDKSLVVAKGAVAEVGLWDLIKRHAATAAGKKELAEHHVENIRFHCPTAAIEGDDIKGTKLIMNRIVTLKEDAKKGSN
ncbi:glutaminyl-tRNA synthetase [Linderina pennispora]|uniref:glutamine--tRNA ligase n=1 Tax=Linderina pennispora TaxID=61395 RepID=A0A1Y1WKN2_9FUNG|nr:glutaminyl-tRNA synthetase [Linderina pennispora]ORX73878.1 glutaminyl-tRNA synthetase [Linderina pennispora]